MATDTIALAEFYDRLAALKWHHLILGDDWKTKREHSDILDVATTRQLNGEPEYMKLYGAFSKYHNSGPAFGTERAPMPQRPSGQLTIV